MPVIELVNGEQFIDKNNIIREDLYYKSFLPFFWITDLDSFNHNEFTSIQPIHSKFLRWFRQRYMEEFGVTERQADDISYDIHQKVIADTKPFTEGRLPFFNNDNNSDDR